MIEILVIKLLLYLTNYQPPPPNAKFCRTSVDDIRKYAHSVEEIEDTNYWSVE